ncbi:WecB/TagA/CpsF family glycosyltransferase [Lignipirellula cremea]|uniref:N-acetylmannosaminyltransferase n=1 Tax=Lignipirellula cremea TaxID=2528010 RepID=A0A518E580_9BACT|nr:WecB/TagA/CpsF family glycosyltransferase [Lignipirellula cremea]QDU99244.1 Putative N-acetylmannosaminyltransferase [Lignipirellula cremea]
MTTERIRLFGIEIDPLTREQAVDRVYAWIENPDGKCRFVVTPNVDHTVMLQHHATFRKAYDDADLVLVDGMPVVLASRMLKKPVPERVTGADLTIDLLAAAARKERRLSVFFLGAADGVANRAVNNVERTWPDVYAVGAYSPPIGFQNDEQENDRILAMIDSANPDILVVGLGAPKQELWVHAHQDRINARVALCVGATIDFLAGEKSRAPLWMQNYGLEWCHRVMTEPKRLAARYAHDAWMFPKLVWCEWWYDTRA